MDEDAPNTGKGRDRFTKGAGNGNSSAKDRQSPIKKRTSSTLTEDNDLDAKREYNRMNASRARKRHKQFVTDLQNRLSQVKQELAEEQKKSAVAQARLSLLMEQNRSLLAQIEKREPSQKTSTQDARQSVAMIAAPPAHHPIFPTASTHTAPTSSPGHSDVLSQIISLIQHQQSQRPDSVPVAPPVPTSETAKSNSRAVLPPVSLSSSTHGTTNQYLQQQQQQQLQAAQVHSTAHLQDSISQGHSIQHQEAVPNQHTQGQAAQGSNQPYITLTVEQLLKQIGAFGANNLR